MMVPESNSGNQPEEDVPSQQQQKVSLRSDLGVEYRAQRFVLKDEAFTVLFLACNWPDEDFEIGISHADADGEILLCEYVDRHLHIENPEFLSPFHLAKDLGEVRQELIASSILTSGILPGDENTRMQYVKSLQSIGKGSIVINESVARTEKFVALILAHEEHHRIYRNATIQDIHLLELGFNEAMTALESTEKDLVLDEVKVSNLKEVVTLIDSRLTTDAEEFWVQLLQPDDHSKLLPEDRKIAQTGKILKAAIQACIKEGNSSFKYAYQIAERQSIQALQEGIKDLDALKAHGF